MFSAPRRPLYHARTLDKLCAPLTYSEASGFARRAHRDRPSVRDSAINWARAGTIMIGAAHQRRHEAVSSPQVGDLMRIPYAHALTGRARRVDIRMASRSLARQVFPMPAAKPPWERHLRAAAPQPFHYACRNVCCGGGAGADVPCNCSQWATGAGVSVSGGVALAFKVALRISYHLDLQSFSANICRYGSCASSFEMYCIVY